MKRKLLPVLGLALILFSQNALAQDMNEKLSMISTLTVNGNYVEIPKDSILRKYLKIEGITEDAFNASKKTMVNWLVEDTAKYRKKKGVLRLPTAAGTRTFTDKVIEGDGAKQYDYQGQFLSLNSYLVRSLFWEDIEYDLVSKKDGAIVSKFYARPFLSPDKKKIFVAYADPYDVYTEISLYNNLNGKIKNTVTMTFENWMPGADDLVFWGKDGKLYMAIQYADKYSYADDGHIPEYHFIKISLL